MSRARVYHRAPEARLALWAADGDLRADAELAHRRTVKAMVDDLAANPPTAYGPPEHIVPLSNTIQLRFQKGAWVFLSLLLIERPSKTQTGMAWELIEAWQGRLDGWQGPQGSAVRILAQQEDRHASPYPPMMKSYAALARGLNIEITQALMNFFEALRARRVGYVENGEIRIPLTDLPLPDPASWGKALLIDFDSLLEWVSRQVSAQPIDLDPLLDLASWEYPPKHWASELQRAVWLMENIGLPHHEIRTICRVAIDNLEAGKHAFYHETPPITSRKIRETLRQYRKNIKPR
jgi:hypothetical protein